MVLNKSISSALIFGNYAWAVSTGKSFPFWLLWVFKVSVQCCCLHATKSNTLCCNNTAYFCFESSVDESGFVMLCVFTCDFFSILPWMLAAVCLCVFGRWWQTLSTLWSCVLVLQLHAHWWCGVFVHLFATMTLSEMTVQIEVAEQITYLYRKLQWFKKNRKSLFAFFPSYFLSFCLLFLFCSLFKTTMSTL